MWEYVPYSLTLSLDKVGRLINGWIDKHLINILVILIGAWVLRHFSAQIISSALRHTIRDDLYPTKGDRQKRIRTLNSLVGAAARVGVYIIATVMIINELGVDTGPLVASAGFLGIALGFGAQSLIKDFVSGIFIIIENQYRVGDIVQLGTVSGAVEDVTIRTTVLRDLNGDVHHIPNGTIAVSTNKTIGYSRINENIVVAYDTDLQRLEHIINHVGEELAATPEFKHKIHEPPRFEGMKGFDKDGIVINIAGKTSAAEQWKITSELYQLLKKAFEKNNIKVISSQVPKT